jgi:hypothetical protein
MKALIPLLVLLQACSCDVEPQPDDTERSGDTAVPERDPWEPPSLPDISAEPNDTREDATVLGYGVLDASSVGGDDPVDWYVVEAGQAGTLDVWAYRSEGALRVYLERDGEEVDRSEQGPVYTTSAYWPSPATWHIGVEADEATDLLLAINFAPETPQVESLEPTTASPGNQVIIRGDRFGNAADDVRVWLGGAWAQVDSVTDEEIAVTVPFGAASGAVIVHVASKHSEHLEIAVDHPDRPELDIPGLADEDLAYSEDGVAYARDRLLITLDPTADEAVIDEVISSWPTEKLGWLPSTNTWAVRFEGAEGAEDLKPILTALGRDARVTGLMADQPVRFRYTGAMTDANPYLAFEDLKGSFIDQRHLYGARGIAGWGDAVRLFNGLGGSAGPEVTIAVPDSGLFSDSSDPSSRVDHEFPTSGASGTFRYFGSSGGAFVQETDETTWRDLHGNLGHGTLIAGIIGAANQEAPDTRGTNGLLTGFQRAGVDDDNDGVYDEIGESIPFRVDAYNIEYELQETSGALTWEVCQYLAGQGYDIVNMSWGWPENPLATWITAEVTAGRLPPGSAIGTPFTAASGTLWFAAVDNANTISDGSTPVQPIDWPSDLAGSLANVVAVGATAGINEVGDVPDVRQPYSNYGYPLTLVAPDTLYTTCDEGTSSNVNEIGYCRNTGTSFATPHAAALAALLRHLNPALDPGTVRGIMTSHGVDVNHEVTDAHGHLTDAWQRGFDPLPRINWVTTLTSPLIINSGLEPDHDALLLFGTDGANDNLWPVPIDAGTGAYTGDTVETVDLSGIGCERPVETQVSADGLRVAVVCADTDSVHVMTVPEWKEIADISLGDIGIHNRAYLSPHGLLHVPYVSGNGHVAIIDVYQGEYVRDVDLGYAYAYNWGTAPVERTGKQVAFLVSDADPGRIVTVESEPWNQRAEVVDSDNFGSCFEGARTPTGIGLSPDGNQLTVTFSHNLSSVELVDVGAGDTTSIDCTTYNHFAQGHLFLSRPYDAAYNPAYDTVGDRILAVPSWDDGVLAIMQETGADYPWAWVVTATYLVTPGANPDRVAWLQTGDAVFMTSYTEETVSYLAFDPNEAGVDLWFDNTYAGMGRPSGLAVTPLAGFISPRHDAFVAGQLSPVLHLRDSDVVRVSCTLGSESSSTVLIENGFAVCPALDANTISSTEWLVATVERDDGSSYEARVQVRRP